VKQSKYGTLLNPKIPPWSLLMHMFFVLLFANQKALK